MKNTIKLASLLLAILFLFSSCQSVYDVPIVPSETTANPEIDLEEEYYTIGMPYHTGDFYSGTLYEGCLIYIETYTTTGIIGYKTSPAGEKIAKYGDVEVSRIVKYNPVTGTVSSPCLDPSCNHSLESGCPMLLGYGLRSHEYYKFKGIFGDWIVYLIQALDDEYGVINTEIMYNLKTGEKRTVFEDNLGQEILERWTAGMSFDGKYYKVKSVLDYSNTGYKSGIGQSVTDYEPKTRHFLYEYDFEADTSKELFEIGENWSLSRVSNKRFYFRMDTGEIVSLTKNGTDQRSEPEIRTSNLVGTYTINYISDGYLINDLKSDEVKEVIFDYSLVNPVCVTEKGILTTYQTKHKERKAFSASKYRENNPNATTEEVNREVRKILASGAAQIWQCGYLGEDNHVIFELPAAYMEIISAYGDYVFATVSRYNPETGEHLEGYDSQPCCINIATGEVTPIPQFDIVVPYWYVN